MTQYAFIIYLDWLLKMFPCQKSLLVIVDRSKIHFGTIITDWLETTNHSSPVPGQVFLVYTLEGLLDINSSGVWYCFE